MLLVLLQFLDVPLLSGATRFQALGCFRSICCCDIQADVQKVQTSYATLSQTHWMWVTQEQTHVPKALLSPAAEGFSSVNLRLHGRLMPSVTAADGS